MHRYYNKDELLKTLTQKDILKIIESVGCVDYKVNSDGSISLSTFYCHKGDSVNKLIYYPNSNDPKFHYGIFKCYTCGDSYNIIEFVIRANRSQGKSITWYKAIEYIATITSYNISITIEKPKHICDMSWLKKFSKDKSTDIIDCKPIDEHVLEMFEYTPHETFLNDHISRETLSTFEISYWGNTNQIVIPHRDRHQNLIGIRGRYLDEEDVENIGKYVPLNIEGKFLSHKLSHNLYGIHINQDKIKACRKCLLLESEKGVMQNHSYFGDDDFSLAVCGSEISEEQVKLLLNYLKIEELILGFDKEYKDPYGWDGELYKNKLFKKIRPIIPYCKVSIIWDKDGLLEYKDAPTDKGKDTLLKLLENKIEITMNDITMEEGTYV